VEGSGIERSVGEGGGGSLTTGMVDCSETCWPIDCFAGAGCAERAHAVSVEDVIFCSVLGKEISPAVVELLVSDGVARAVRSLNGGGTDGAIVGSTGLEEFEVVGSIVGERGRGDR
jgi:hypothetical protein